MKDRWQEFEQAAEELQNAWRAFIAPAVNVVAVCKGHICNILDKMRKEEKQ